MEPELIILADRPRPGEAKTRLLSRYTPEQASGIAEFLIRATVELAVANWPGEVSLYGWPSATHVLFEELKREYRIRLAAQSGGDAGARVQRALAEGIARNGAAAVMTCDVPHCPWEVIDQANDWLARGRNIIGPTEEGGCYFIGLQQADPKLFEGIAWENPRLCNAILMRADELGIEFEPLPALHGLETPEDLWLVAQSYEPLRPYIR